MENGRQARRGRLSLRAVEKLRVAGIFSSERASCGQDTHVADNFTASLTAARKLPGLATPCQAMSKAVP